MPDDPLRQYVDRLFEEDRRWTDARFDSVQVQFESIQRAVDKAELMMRDKLEGMNEMRAQLNRQAGEFVTLKEAQIMRAADQKQMLDLKAVVDNFQGRGVVIVAIWPIIVGLGMLLLGRLLH